MKHVTGEGQEEGQHERYYISALIIKLGQGRVGIWRYANQMFPTSQCSVRLCMFVCARACTQMSMHVQRQEDNLGCHSSGLVHLPGTHQVCQAGPNDPPVDTCHARLISMYLASSYMGSGY